MAFIRRKTNFQKNDNAEKDKILEAFWMKCIQGRDEAGVKYLIIELQKYMKERPPVFQLSIEENINQIKTGMSLESFKKALQWITPLESKLIDLFENLKVIEEIESVSTKEEPIQVTEDDVQILKEYLETMKMSVSMTIGNVSDQQTHSIQSSNMSSSFPFATHSVTKIFTGVLALKMIEQGVLSESMLQEPIKNLISKEVWKHIPSELQEHLEQNKITLYQLMTHKGGVGDYYNNVGGYREKLEKQQLTANAINDVQDFLQFCDTNSYEPGVYKYSNVGITLVGLALEECYRKENPNVKVSFDDILYEFVLKPAGINRSDFTKNMPPDGKYNQADPVAKDWVGGPAGGYWAKAETLEKFNRWLYEQCNINPTFMKLVHQYGQEFYKEDRNVIEHPGTFNTASSFFYLSLNSGNMLNVLSDQQLIAPMLTSTIRRSMFSSPANELPEQLVKENTQFKKP